MATKLSNLINPEVMAPFLDKKMVDLLKFAPVAHIGYELQGQAGNTLTLPTWKYIGAAADLAEGVADVPTILEATSTSVTVKKAVKSVEITDEAVLSAYGDPMGQIESQLALAMADKVDQDVIAAVKTLTRTHNASAFNMDVVADALVLFGEDINEEMFLFINPANYAVLRKSADFVHIGNGEAKVSGQVGRIYGVNVVISNRVGVKEAFILKFGAIGIEMKREVSIETDRDILRKTSVVSVDRHYVAYVRDDSRGVKIAIGA